MSIKVGDAVGDYEVIGVLGAGGMGQVYKVHNVLSNRLEAMKVLLPGALGTPDQGERFLREIRVQASLDHPNIAALRTALRIDNQLVMILELVEGKTLQAMLERGPLSTSAAVDYMSQALAALAYAHEHGVIHRDIKPGNIMLTQDGIIKLTDFGIAKAAFDRSLTATGSTMGSIYYMSPEQVKGSNLDARSDLYSLGVTLYEAVTGSRPFQDATDYAILTAHLSEPPVPPLEKNPSLPPELNQVILKSLAKDPAARFQTATEFRQALQNIGDLPGEGPATRPLPVPDAALAGTGRGTMSPSQQAVSHPTGSKSSASGTLEMAYVLFMDIVAYSTLTMDRQTERISKLVEIVRNTDEFRRAQENDQIISLPTGDGMALVFFQNPIAPIQCATEVSRTLKSHPELKLRMGVHTGPVYRIPDINTNRNVAGGGINMAQRVMDCGDAGHILVSKAVADTLGQLSDWEGRFHDLGEAEVKHGVKVHIVNFYTDEVGNPELPQKIRKAITVQAQTVPPGAAPSISPIPSIGPAPTINSAPSISPAPAISPMPVAAPRRNTGLVVGIVAVILLALGVTQFMHRQGSGPSKNTEMPASLAPSMPTMPPAPPSPPTGGTPAAIPPSGSLPPPQTPLTSSTPSQAAPPPAISKTAEARQGLSGKAVAAAQRMQPSQAAPIAAAPASSAAQAAASAEKALLQEQRERMILLAGRAAAVRGSVQNLERQQNRSGLGLRPDMAAAKESMGYLMGEANASLAAGDAAATKRNLDLAEKQVEKLEGFLGR